MFAPELVVDVTALSALVVNYWTSNPVGGVRFEMRLPYPKAVGVAVSGAAYAFSVSSVAAGVAPAPARG